MKPNAHDTAHESAERPLIPSAVVVDQERQAEDVEKIGHRQVDQDDAAALPGTQLCQVNADRCYISNQAHNEDETISHRQVVVFHQFIQIGTVGIVGVIDGHSSVLLRMRNDFNNHTEN